MTTETTTNRFRAEQDSVAVVGAGPTGVMLAIELARRGVNVQVFERLSAPPTESRATGIHARTLEIFRQLGLVDQFLAVASRIGSNRFSAVTQVAVVALGRVSLDPGRSAT